MNYARGSTWRKWDLHFHTPTSPEYYNGSVTNEDIIKVLKDNEIALVAVTDHHNIDVARISELKKIARDEITILPGIEFCSDLGGSEPVHFIGIFSEDSDYSNIWDSMRGKLDLTPKDINDRGGYEKIYCPFEKTSEIVHKFGGIVTIHAGRKSHTIENITNALSHKQAQKRDIVKSIEIFEVGKLKDIGEYKDKVYPNIDKHPPMIICSDNHDATKYSLKSNCWIKADPTFKGLKQIINEPDRVYVGEYPPIFERIKNNKTKYIKSIYINRSEGFNLDEKWFDQMKVVVNPELVSVIGNKGSGKSALLDIMGLTCNSKNIKDFSFLNKEKFRDPKNNKSKHFVAQIEWESNESTEEVLLSENPEISSVEKVKYIPQKYLESLCSDRDDKFEKELKKVIFSHIPDEDRFSCATLGELVSYKSEIAMENIKLKKNDISKLNSKVIKLESCRTEEYKKEIMQQLEQKRAELRAHLTAKPEEVKKPEDIGISQNEKALELEREIQQLESALAQLEQDYERIKKDKITNKENLSKFRTHDIGHKKLFLNNAFRVFL